MSLQARAFQQACRGRLLLSDVPPAFPASTPRLLHRSSYATQSSPGDSSGTRASQHPQRKAITVTSDDGRINWSELSTREKAARSTQQSVNFVIVAAGAAGTIIVAYLLYTELFAAGAAGTIIVAYLLYTELFAADSKTRQFNHAVDRVKSDSRCIELLGRPASKIKAYGEPTTNKWARARPLAHTTEIDKFGTTHFRMHFHIEGTEAHGVVNVHMSKRKEEKELTYELLSLNIQGQPVIYLENKADEGAVKAKVGKMFGVQWR